MGKHWQIWFVIAALLILAGAGLFAAAMAANSWDFTKLNSVPYETNTHVVTETFTGIRLETDTADIVLVPASEEGCKVVCYELQNVRHSVTVEDGTLTVRVTGEKQWYDYIGIQFGRPKVTVYLPLGLYTELSIHCDTGDVEIPKDFTFERMDIQVSTGDVNTFASVSGRMTITASTGHISAGGLSAGSMDLQVSTGNITLTGITCDGQLSVRVSTGELFAANVRCQNFTSSGSTGNLVLRDLVAEATIRIQRSTGDVEFEGCDAEEIFVDTDTGHVKGTLLSRKFFRVETDTGRVQVPPSISGGLCQIKTNTGDVILSISGSAKNP